MPHRRIFLALPHYGPVEREHSFAVSDAQTTEGVFVQSESSSLLARCFNVLWCSALNSRQKENWTHFVMLHADIYPDRGWLPKLLDEMDRVDADIMSAASPIKDQTGDTSLAVLDSERRDVERLHINFLAKLPATFDSRDVGGPLLINTGCMAVRFDRPDMEKLHFCILDNIEQNEQGEWEPRGMPEDWYFSQLAHQLGKSVWATQIIGLTHYGRQGWRLPAREVTA